MLNCTDLACVLHHHHFYAHLHHLKHHLQDDHDHQGHHGHHESHDHHDSGELGTNQPKGEKTNDRFIRRRNCHLIDVVYFLGEGANISQLPFGDIKVPFLARGLV